MPLLNPRGAIACLLRFGFAWLIVVHAIEAAGPAPPVGVQKLVAGGVTYTVSLPETLINAGFRLQRSKSKVQLRLGNRCSTCAPCKERSWIPLKACPIGWTRDGTSLDTPQILSLGSPPTPVLALRDRDPSNTGGWLARGPNVVPVTPGTVLRVVCEEVYSIGRGGDSLQSYHNLQSGRYDFLVQGVDELGHPVGAGIRLPLVIVPPLLQAFWFRSLLAGMVTVGLIGGVRYATWRKAHRQLEPVGRAHAIEAERTRIARDLHDEMGSRLTQISLLAARAAQSAGAAHAAAEPLAQMQRAAHALAATLDEIVWATNPQHDTLPALGDHLSNYAVEALTAGGVRCRLEVPTSLPNVPLSTGNRFRLMMVVKEALTNVLKHASASEACVRLVICENAITLSILDNGVGLQSAHVAERNGLRNMRERMREIGGSCEISTPAEGGTFVKLHLPLRRELVP